MSKVKIQGNASGTGVVTLTAPNTNTDRTITLPDSSDTLVSTAPSTSGNILTSDGTNWTSAAPAAAGADTSLSNLSSTGENKVCQAWVNFNGTGTVAIRDSYNVSSITDQNTGLYDVNFTNALANVNYAAVFSHGFDAAIDVSMHSSATGNDVPPTTSRVRVRTTSSTGSATEYDQQYIQGIIFGD